MQRYAGLMFDLLPAVCGGVMGAWVYNVVKVRGDNPWPWSISSFFLWFIVPAIVGFKYDDLGLKVAGVIGLLVAAGLLFRDIMVFS